MSVVSPARSPLPQAAGFWAERPWWLLCLIPVLAGALSELLLGFRLPYWRNADQDLVLAYQGLLLNGGLPQEYFDHPGYIYFLLIAGWYRLLDLLGLLPVATLSALPSAADTVAFEAAWQTLIEWGRALSILLCAGFVATVATLVRVILDDKRIGLLAGIAFAFAVGMATQARQMRTDLPSAWFAATALLLVMAVVVRRPPSGWSAALLALAGACASLAVICKVQAVFPLLAIPVIAWAFASRDRSAPLPRGGGWLLAGGLAVLAGLALVPAVSLILDGIAGAPSAIYPYRPIGAGLSGGVYQGLIVAWGVLGVLAVAVRLRLSAACSVQALAAVIGGAALGLLALRIVWHPQNAIAVANLVEHMFVFSTWRHTATLGGEAQVLSGGLAGLLAEGLWRTVAIRTVVLHPDNLPQTLLLEWFAIAAGVTLWRRGRRGEALRIALLLAIAWGLETLFSLRGFQRAYAAYTDPLVVLAAALALAAFPALLQPGRGRQRLFAALALYVGLAHVWPAVSERRHIDPAQHCYWIPTYMPRVEPFPFCRAQAVP